jgi:hypothetical protein
LRKNNWKPTGDYNCIWRATKATTGHVSRKNETVANDDMKDLKEFNRASFVQNLYDIIQGK